MYLSGTIHSAKPNRQNVSAWNGHGQRGRVTMAIPGADFSAVLQLHRTSYAARSALATGTLLVLSQTQ